MLVTSLDLMRIAEAKNQAVAAFNINSLANLQAVIAAAEELNEGIIVEFATVQQEDGIMSLEDMGPIMIMMAEKAKVPVCVHLDHGVDLDFIKQALDMGFTSCMFDASALPYEENVAKTIMAVDMARSYGVPIEAELGKMAGHTLNNEGEVENRAINRSDFTDPDQAKDYVTRTGIDMLACSFGTSHGMYTAAPKLDFDLIKEIREKTGVPVVMHGSSGVADEDYAPAINNGVRKINYYTYMAKDAGEAVVEAIKADPDKVWFHHDFDVIGRERMKQHALHAIKLFQNK